MVPYYEGPGIGNAGVRITVVARVGTTLSGWRRMMTPVKQLYSQTGIWNNKDRSTTITASNSATLTQMTHYNTLLLNFSTPQIKEKNLGVQ